MDDARALAGRLRAMAAEPWKHDGGSWPDPMREAADYLDRLAAPKPSRMAEVAEAAEAERDTLRAALEDILGCDPYETKDVARDVLKRLNVPST
jgi:hypothetical protein